MKVLQTVLILNPTSFQRYEKFSRLHNFILLFPDNSHNELSVCTMKAARSACTVRVVPCLAHFSHMQTKPYSSFKSPPCFLLGFSAEKILFCLLWIPIRMSWEINLVVSVPSYLYYSWFCSLLIPKWNRKCAPFFSSYSAYCVLLHQTREPLQDCFLIKWE